MHARTLAISVRPPFELALAIDFLRGFSPCAGEQRIDGATLTKAWLVRGQPITATIAQTGDAALGVALASPAAIDDAALAAMRARIAAYLGAEDELAPLYALAERDPAFAPIARRLRGLHQVRFATPLECACWGVLNQRIGMRAARTLKAALVARYGAPGCDAFPEAAPLAAASERELEVVLGNPRKARAVAAVARAFAGVDEAWLHRAPIGEVEAWLRAIHGVGDFTTGFVMFRGLGRAIALPWGARFIEAARATYPGCDRAELERRGEAYGPWRGYWSLYLWAATFVATPGRPADRRAGDARSSRPRRARPAAARRAARRDRA